MKVDGVVLTPIPSKRGFSNYLCDTINGRVYSLKSDMWLKNDGINSNGYVYNTLVDDNGKASSYGVHRIVLASYTGVPLERFKRGGIECDHINEELKHVNGIHNLQMSDRHGQYKKSTIERMKKPKPRLKEEQVCEIFEQLQEWLETDGKISDFIKMMCEAYDRPYRGMWNIVHGKCYKHLHEKMNIEVA